MKRLPMHFAYSVLAALVALASISCGGDKASSREALKKPFSKRSEVTGPYQEKIREWKTTAVAKINGVPVSKYDLIKEMNTIAPKHLKPKQGRSPRVAERIRKEALNRLVYRELAAQEAKRQGMKVPPGDIAEEIDKIKADMKTEEAFRQKLVESGITEDDLRRQVERGMLIGMVVRKEIFGKVTVGPDAAKDNESMAAALHRRENEWIGQLKKTARIEIASTRLGKDDRGKKR